MEAREQVAKLYMEAREAVYRYFLTFGIAPAQAQELTQDSFLRLYQSMRGDEPIRGSRHLRADGATRLGTANLSLEHRFPREGTLVASYVGSHGVDGLRREGSAVAGSKEIGSLVSTNDGSSHFEALELHDHRALAAGLSSTVAYTWSHSIDNGSWDDAVYYTQGPWTPAADRASSSFDVRHNFTTSLVWQRKNWTVAAIARARSGFPIDVLTTENLLGLSFR